MKRLMHDASGIGLAATQVGVLQRLFVFHPGEDDDVVAVVNPEIVERSKRDGGRRRGLPLDPGLARSRSSAR